MPSELPQPPRYQREAWMRLALDQARLAASHQDVPIGAVITDASGRVIGLGRNQRELDGDPTAHAEVQAIRQAAQALGSWRLDGCTLTVTLEPCLMCAGAILLARIPTLVMGAWEPKTGAVGSIYDVLRDPTSNHWVEVYPGVLEEESAQLLQSFFQDRRS